MASTPAAPPGDASHTELLEERVRMGERHILIVDDDEDIRTSMRMYLEGCLTGVDVHTAASGEQALGVLSGLDIDVILSDYQMEGMDGVAFLARAREEQPGARRVLMTGHAGLEVAIGAVNEGRVDRFLTKPLDPLKIVELVYDLLQARREVVERAEAYRRAIDMLGEGTPEAGFSQA